jgi:hypothetical protein
MSGTHFPVRFFVFYCRSIHTHLAMFRGALYHVVLTHTVASESGPAPCVVA